MNCAECKLKYNTVLRRVRDRTISHLLARGTRLLVPSMTSSEKKIMIRNQVLEVIMPETRVRLILRRNFAGLLAYHEFYGTVTDTPQTVDMVEVRFDGIERARMVPRELVHLCS